MIDPCNDDFKVRKLGESPTPEERAEFVILQLEQFIRDGRTIDEGMSFKKWQTMAQAEIATAIAEAVRTKSAAEAIGRRLVFVSAAAMVSIGFWGAAVSLGNVSYFMAGTICVVAGLILLTAAGYRRFEKHERYRKAAERRRRIKRIRNLNNRIKHLETALEEEEELLEENLRKRQVLKSG